MKNTFNHTTRMKIGNSMTKKMSSHIGTITKVLYPKEQGTYCEVLLSSGITVKQYIDYSTPIYN